MAIFADVTENECVKGALLAKSDNLTNTAR